jgi:hypothetical protein
MFTLWNSDNCRIKTVRHLIQHLDECLFTDAYREQIRSIIIDIGLKKDRDSRTSDGNCLLFTHILTTFRNLQTFYFGSSQIWHQYLSFVTLPSTLISSTLLQLHVCLNTLSECLSLLDGRFKQLRVFHIKVNLIDLYTAILDNKVTVFGGVFDQLK